MKMIKEKANNIRLLQERQYQSPQLLLNNSKSFLESSQQTTLNLHVATI